jgi:signal transduction histidine kinase
VSGAAERSGVAVRSDARLVRRAAVVIAVQTGAAVAVVVTAVALLVLVLTVREQRADALRIVRTAALSADDVSDPPSGVSLLLRAPDGRLKASARTPTGLRSLDLAQLPTGASELEVAGGGDGDGDRPGGGGADERHAYEVYVVDRDGQRVVAALDSRYRSSETDRLVTSLVVAGAVGIAAAVLVGWLIGTRAVRPLGTALALQRRFVADASHELRTPLTVLHTRAQLLARRAEVDPRTREELGHLVDDARALADIASDLLLSAEMQHRPERREPVDLVELGRQVVGSFAAAAEQAGTALVLDAPLEPVVVSGVPVALRRAINALVDNALSHTDRGDTVTVGVARRDTDADLAVIDTGEGFDPAEASALTERFARGARSTDRHRFGLGLALVREIVQAHDGTLTLDGRPGAGATATITLPGGPG